MDFDIILACDDAFGIGKNFDLPWSIKEDMRFFRELTESVPPSQTKLINAVIMGRVTADILTKPLPNRINVVITSSIENYHEGFILVKDLDQALKLLSSITNINRVFVIGGARLAESAIYHPRCRSVYLNTIHYDYDCDTCLSQQFRSRLKGSFVEDNKGSTKTIIATCKKIDTIVMITFRRYIYINHEEQAYLNMLEKIITTGDLRQTRNAKTYSVFGEKLVFDLANGFPLLTTKKMFYRGIFEELLFFLRGYTNTKLLEDNKVMIWHSNTTKEFIINNNKELAEYDMGPMYGFVWRHYGVRYQGLKVNGINLDYRGQGIDQFKNVVDLIVSDPHSRRILMTSYDPSQADVGVLYPCHGLTIQFYVENNKISLQMYQRSADSVLGCPYNIASYALLLLIVTELVNNHVDRTHQDDYYPGRVIMVFGDTHVYSDEKSNHVLTVKEQLLRRDKTYPFPTIKFKKALKTIDDVELMTSSDIEVINYVSHPALTAVMYE